VTDHDALRRAIIDHPDEDTPRLVYADWLDEHADDTRFHSGSMRTHAQFIRADVLMAQRNEFDPERLKWELIDKPRLEAQAWTQGVLPRVPAGVQFDRAPLFRRGFPWAVRFDSQTWNLPQPPVAAFPLERVCYEQCGYFGIDQLRGAAWRGRLRAVEFGRGYSAAVDPRRLFTMDGLDRLEAVAFRSGAVNAAEADNLIRSPLYGRLSALTITESPVGATLVPALAHARTHPLRELHLIGCRLTPAALGAIVGVHAGGRLESLSAGGDRIGAPEKFRVFARADLPPLRSLDMSDDAPKESGLETFLASPVVRWLQRLRLAGCNLNGARVRLLAGGAFANLRALNLARNSVGNDGLTALARSPHLAGLRVLNLSYTQAGDEGILALLESPLADGLALLDLTGSPASEETKELLVGRMGDRVRI
jgi:uncharacterized protein (TIGR02996 family)